MFTWPTTGWGAVPPAKVDPTDDKPYGFKVSDATFLVRNGWASGTDDDWSHPCLAGRWLPIQEAVTLQVRILAGTGRWC